MAQGSYLTLRCESLELAESVLFECCIMQFTSGMMLTRVCRCFGTGGRRLLAFSHLLLLFGLRVRPRPIHLSGQPLQES